MVTENIVFYSARGFFLTVLAGLLKMVFALSRKRITLYFAKGCLAIAMISNDEVEDAASDKGIGLIQILS